MISTERSLAVCICTADRPALLQRCLESIFAGHALPDQIVVSDDGIETDPTRRVCSRFPAVDYRVGPRRGQPSNRNVAIASCRTTHLSLLDDDALVTPGFIDRAKRWIVRVDDRTLLTGELFEDESAVVGDDVQGGTQRRPVTNMTFWGFGGGEVRGGLRCIHANCNVLPRQAFSEVQFDERLTYGPDTEDLCAHLLAIGYKIRYVPDLVTWHVPPSRDPDHEEGRRRESTRARFYVTLKRYFFLEKRIRTGLAFLVLAPVREVLSSVRGGKLHAAATVIPDFVAALRWVFEYRRCRHASLD